MASDSSQGGIAKSAAAHFLATLKTCGVDTLLANSGTDFPSIVEALASPPPEGASYPDAMVIHHESVAMAMAHGYYLACGNMAAVMVHVNVGLANTTMGMLNAAAAQVPVMICSGRTPLTEEGRFGSRSLPIHWGQEMFDQASLVREAVKWDHELHYPEQAGALVSRACSIAQSEPAGPVYLSLPREVLAENAEQAHVLPPKTPNAISVPSNKQIEEAAQALANAENPVIVVQRSGHLGELDHIAELVEAAAIPLVEFWSSVSCLPNTHDMHAGFNPNPIVSQADVVLTIGAMVPWTPSQTDTTDLKIIHLGSDPLVEDRPMRGFAADILLQGNAPEAISLLYQSLVPMLDRAKVASRRERQIANKKQQSEQIETAIAQGTDSIMNHAYVSRVLSEAAGQDAMFFSELGAVGEALKLDKPGTLFWTPLSGGLGWGVPAAMGAKLAQPGKTVIATVGDGSYIFANPVACHQVCSAHNLPILTVVFNNGVWNAVKRATTGMYPQGNAVKANEMPLTDLGPSPNYCGIMEAHGGYAERVELPHDLPAAVERALKEVRENGRQALLEVKVA